MWITPDAEKTIMYCARVSNPANQNSENTGLLKYCIKNGHWSIFEMANACFEIETSRAIAAQILRHRSFSFQEFSQRYAEAQGFITYNARSQDLKNRQNSLDNMSIEDKVWFSDAQLEVQTQCERLYNKALKKGIAKEQARFLLPQSTTTRMYMNGTIRSWLHYLQLRTGNGTQLEHQEIAKSIWEQLSDKLPTIMEAL
jgi:thymidylate synthase (FAD)